MQRTIQWLALLLSVLLLVLPCLSCTENLNGTDGDESVESSSESLFGPDVPMGEDGPQYVFEIRYPSVTVSSMEFTLTDDKLTEYQDKMSAVRALYDEQEEGSEDAFRHALYELLSLEAEIAVQKDIAYLLYYCDLSDSELWDRYLYAYDLHAEAYGLFWGFFNEVKEEKNALSEVLVEVVEGEYGEHMLPNSSNTDFFAKKMEVLEGQYNAKKDSGASDAEMFEIYRQYVAAANSYAHSRGAENYYEYASRHVFQRDDTHEQRELLRQYVKQYMVPLCKTLRAKSQDYDRRLSAAEYTRSNQYLEDPYDSFAESYLFDYFATLPTSAGDAMRSAFEKDRVLVGDSANAYRTAMVSVVGDTPICYFHKDSTTLETVSHEIGHYYAHIVEDSDYYAMDLKETHSTANTMLLFAYLSERLDDKGFTSAEIYALYNWTYQIVNSVIKDEFDEIIFGSNASKLTLADYERIMSELVEEYDATSLSNNAERQLMTYWRRLGIVYPMSNYCYATAGIAAFQVFVKAKDDYASACEIYRRLVEEPVDEGAFLPTVEKSGLLSPYGRSAYLKLQRIITFY